MSGDEDVLCLELIQFLASRGARKFLLASNNKSPSGYKSLTLKRLKNKSVTISESFYDPSTPKGAEDLLKEATVLGPVSGIYHISTVSILNLNIISMNITNNIKICKKKNRPQKPAYYNR